MLKNWFNKLSQLERYSYTLPVRSWYLQAFAVALIVTACLVAIFFSFRLAGFVIVLLLVYLLAVRWAQRPQSHTFAAKSKVTDSLIIIVFAISIAILSLVAPS